MASSYKYFTSNDQVVATNQLVENIEWQGDGQWVTSSNAPNYFVKFATGSEYFALANPTFDITFGRSSETTGESTDLQIEKNIYNQFAKVLVGYNADNTIKKFDVSGSELHNAYFISFPRRDMKDRIKQGSVELNFITASGGDVNYKLVDNDGSGVKVYESPTGYYSYLYVTGSDTTSQDTIDASSQKEQGLIFYEAGVAVISPYIYSSYVANANPSSSNTYINENILGVSNTDPAIVSGSTGTIADIIVSGTIKDNCVMLGEHIYGVKYSSITELNSTVYFCRAFNHEFNYSSNPTFLSGSEIVVKGGDPEVPTRTYVTSVGLYSDDNQLLAVAKLSEPIVKSPENEFIAKVRIDY